MLLDPITGDLYEYNTIYKKWQPRYNSGLHYKQMNESDKTFKHMIPRKIFVAQAVEEEFPLIQGVNVEAIIRPDNVGFVDEETEDSLFARRPPFQLFGHQPHRLDSACGFFFEPRQEVPHFSKR